MNHSFVPSSTAGHCTRCGLVAPVGSTFDPVCTGKVAAVSQPASKPRQHIWAQKHIQGRYMCTGCGTVAIMHNPALHPSSSVTTPCSGVNKPAASLYTLDPIASVYRCTGCLFHFPVIDWLQDGADACMHTCIAPPAPPSFAQLNQLAKTVYGGLSPTAASSNQMANFVGDEYGLSEEERHIAPRAGPKCECGAASTGAKAYAAGHSSWCPTAAGKEKA